LLTIKYTPGVFLKISFLFGDVSGKW